MSTSDQDPQEKIALLERRLLRSQRALKEAETALELRVRELAQANSSLKQREEELAERLQLEGKQLIAAQRVGGFATIVGRPGMAYQSSPELNRILGFSPGMKIEVEHLISRIHPLDRRRILKEANRFFSELVSDVDHEFSHRIIHPKKGVRWLQWFIRRNSGKQGEPKSVLGTVRDITEIRGNERKVKALQLRAERRVRELARLTDELQAERSRAEAALQVRTRFLSTMAHQFRTPLVTISGLLETYSEEALDEPLKKRLMLAERSAERISALLDEALAEADGSSHSVSLFTAPLELDVFFKQSREYWGASLTTDGTAKLTLTVGSGLPAKVDADALRLRELFDDLAGSWIEAYGSIRIHATWNGKLVLTLRPDGPDCPAMAQETMENDPQMRRAGQLAEAMGGTVQFDSENAQLVVKLMLRPIANEISESEQPLTTSAGEQPQVLLAEDTESNRAIIAAMLEKLGCCVETAVNGAEALEAATGKRFDAILMDVMMPIMDGEEAVRRIRAAPEPYSRTPVIGITAHTLQEERERLLAAGMSACLSKPVKKMELRSSLKTAFGVKALDSARAEEFDLEQFCAAFEAVPPHYRARFLEAVELDLRNYGSKLVQNLEKADFAEADKNAHALKGVAGNLGAVRLLDGIAGLRARIESEEAIDPAAMSQMLNEASEACRKLFEARYGAS